MMSNKELETFCQLFQQYQELSVNLQHAVKDMAEIVNDAKSDNDEKMMAIETLREVFQETK